jgi:hypothetical protein
MPMPISTANRRYAVPTPARARTSTLETSSKVATPHPSSQVELPVRTNSETV